MAAKTLLIVYTSLFIYSRLYSLTLRQELAACLFVTLLWACWSLVLADRGRQQQMYGFSHGILNGDGDTPDMWMNMGYWRDDAKDDMPTACRALLDRLLQHAGLLKPPRPSSKGRDGDRQAPLAERSIDIVDVGIGCGDQSIHLLELSAAAAEARDGSFPLVRSYLGITNVEDQARFASGAVRERFGSLTPGGRPVEIVCADGGDPGRWTGQLVGNGLSAGASHGSDETQRGAELWLLGLDSLYHLKPSRMKLLRHARARGASFMAFDLLLSDESKWKQLRWYHWALLRLLCLALSTPWGNFMTAEQYKEHLGAAGYELDEVEIVDISDHVFKPLARFLRRRDGELRKSGKSIGKFKVAGWAFGWWGRSGIVRGCLVVAKRRQPDRS